MIKCDAHCRPFPTNKALDCESTELNHITHRATLKDYAYPGSSTEITWSENDRRNYHGNYPGDCSEPLCTLPLGHKGNHS